jgi:hypothetical protein
MEQTELLWLKLFFNMENKQYVLLDQTGKYINTVIWDGDFNKWSPPDNTTIISIENIDPSILLNVSTLYTAEEWITNCGFSSLQIIALLDFENKLNKLEIFSEKLTAVRMWLDSILLTYTLDPTPKNNWPQPPYSFDETVKEVKSFFDI